jgi:hypothetical protein
MAGYYQKTQGIDTIGDYFTDETGQVWTYTNSGWSKGTSSTKSGTVTDPYKPQIVSIGGYDYEVTNDPTTGENYYNMVGQTPAATDSSQITQYPLPSGQPQSYTDANGNVMTWNPYQGTYDQAGYNSTTGSAASTAMTDYQKASNDLAQKQYELDVAKQNASTQVDLANIQLQQQQLDMEKEQFAQNYGLSQQEMAQNDAQYAASLGLQQQQFTYQQQNDAANREQEAALQKQEYLQQLLAKGPASWLDLALYEGYTPKVQDFQTGQNQLGGSVPGLLTGQYSGLKTGDQMPGWQGISTTPASTSGSSTVATTPYTPYTPTTQTPSTTTTQSVTPNIPTLTPQTSSNLVSSGVQTAASQTGLSTQAIQDMMNNSGVDAAAAASLILSNRQVASGSTGNAPNLTTTQQQQLQTSMPSSYDQYLAQGLTAAQGQAATSYLSSNPTYENNQTWAQRATDLNNSGLLNAPTPAPSTPELTPEQIAQLEQGAIAGYAGYASGGYPKGGKPFIVGERGPELGMFRGNKLTIVPFNKIPGMANGGTISNTYYPYVDDLTQGYNTNTSQVNETAPTMTAINSPPPGYTGNTSQSTTPASTLQSTLPSLLNPSRQYQARMNPDQLAMYYAYEQMRTGATPEAQAWKLSAYAPPGGYNAGLTYNRR